MITKFLESDKLIWQRVTALEVALELSKRPDLLVVLCRTQRDNRGTNSHRDLLIGVDKVGRGVWVWV
jgi:hypothetical protein